MKDSTKRSIRTVLQTIVALAATLPVIVAGLNLPAGKAAEIGAVLVAAAGIVSKVVNALEEAGYKVGLPK